MANTLRHIRIDDELMERVRAYKVNEGIGLDGETIRIILTKFLNDYEYHQQAKRLKLGA